MSARLNMSTRGKLLDMDYRKGAFRYVAKGVYTDGNGPRNGQPCVGKWFKERDVYDDAFFAADLKTVHTAQKLIDAFNAEGIIDNTIWLNQPEVWIMNGGSRDGQRILVEPFIEGFCKFNSNTGCVTGNTPWHKVMQALSHFSYHKSGGQLVLCDLQGGIVRRSVQLTDPAILSRSQGRYGPTDLGPDGIETFFARHECNKYCRQHWQRPRVAAVCHYAARVGTTMELLGSAQQLQPWRLAQQPFYGAIYEESDEYDSDSDSDDYY